MPRLSIHSPEDPLHRLLQTVGKWVLQAAGVPTEKCESSERVLP